jgi:hypothetical protein
MVTVEVIKHHHFFILLFFQILAYRFGGLSLVLVILGSEIARVHSQPCMTPPHQPSPRYSICSQLLGHIPLRCRMPVIHLMQQAIQQRHDCHSGPISVATVGSFGLKYCVEYVEQPRSTLIRVPNALLGMSYGTLINVVL